MLKDQHTTSLRQNVKTFEPPPRVESGGSTPKLRLHGSIVSFWVHLGQLCVTRGVGVGVGAVEVEMKCEERLFTSIRRVKCGVYVLYS